MKLRTKVLTILATIWVLISLGIYIDARLTLSNDYIKLENREVEQNISRVEKSFENIFENLNTINTDWSQWNDMYKFTQTKDPKFVKSNILPTAFANLKINFMLIFNTAGQLVFGKDYDMDKKDFVPTIKSLTNYLSPTILLNILHNKSDNPRVIKMPEGLVAFSLLPILTSEGKGPSPGSLLMGYLLNNSHFQKMSQILDMKIEFIELPLQTKNKIILNAYDALQKSKYAIAPKDRSSIYGFTLINDVNGIPVGMLKVETPRILYNEGLLTIRHYL